VHCRSARIGTFYESFTAWQLLHVPHDAPTSYETRFKLRIARMVLIYNSFTEVEHPA
jgi:hypothetical protein